MGFGRFVKQAVAVASGPAGMVAAAAKTIAPKSTVSDIIATSSPAAVPMIENQGIKTAAVVGYSTAAIVGGSMVAAQAAAAAGAGTVAQGGAAVAGGTATKVAVEAGGAEAFKALEGQQEGMDAFYGYEEGGAMAPADGGFSVSKMLNAGKDIVSNAISAVTGKKTASAGSAGTVQAGMFGDDFTGIAIILALGALAYFIVKKVMK